MNCAKCGHGNPAGTKFCGECGTRLASGCAACGAENPPGNKFCGACGASLGTGAGERNAPVPNPPRHLAERILQSRQALEGERKQVTVLFADMKGSMELLADRDPEEARKLLDPVLEQMMQAVHHYEGTVNQVMGDGIMALFGAPLAHEDHAVRACYAALRMQEAVRRYTEALRSAHGVEVQIRVGLNSGEVVVRSIGSDLRMDYSAVGQTTHLAARMEQLATPGTIRLTAGTLALAEGYVAVKSFGPIPVKGLAQPVEVYELTGAGEARTRLQVSRARGLSRFVGRDSEMEQLRHAAEQSRAGRGQVVAVVGEPGVGKSRLYYEFLQSHHAREFLVLESGSVSYGKATPFLPLADLLRSYFMINARDDVRRIRVKVTGGLLTVDEALKDAIPVALWLLDALPEDSPFLKLEPAERRRQTFAALKRILLREIEGRPLLLVFEDLHWIDSETQAFLDGFIDSVPATRVLLAVNYRPEYRHGWASRTYYRQLRVDPLAAQSAEDLLTGLLGNDPSVASLRPLLIARTEGRPLFLEESVRMLVETGALAGERGAYRLVRAVDSLQVPATVQAILAARIDRLEPEDKRLLQAAAVIGTHVPFAVLMAVAAIDEDSLRRGLARLQAAEFMYEARLFPELEFAFKHALTHEVAYGGVLQERRQALHRAAVEAIERIYVNRLAEQIERLAHHAVNGRLPKAARYLKEAGSKAVGRSANREAAAYFEQALVLLAEMPQTPENLSAALDIRLAYGPALIALKGARAPEVESLYQPALELADRLGDAQRRFQVLWNFWYIKFTRGDYPLAMQAAQALQQEAERSGDDGQILEYHHAIWPTLSAMGQPVRAVPHMERGVQLYVREKHASQALVYGGHDAGACSRWHLGMNRWLLGFPDQAVGNMQDALRLADELQHPQTTGLALTFSSWLQHQRGEHDVARQNAERLTALSEAHGFRPYLDYARVLRHVYDLESTDVQVLRELCNRELAALSVSQWRRAFCICVLAERCAQAGHANEARSAMASLVDLDRGTFYAAEIARVEGELMLRSATPDASEAEGRFRRALEIARERAMKSFELRAAMSLARLWREKGRREDARELLAPVYGWFTEGFETADLKSARSLLAELGAA